MESCTSSPRLSCHFCTQTACECSHEQTSGNYVDAYLRHADQLLAGGQPLPNAAAPAAARSEVTAPIAPQAGAIIPHAVQTVGEHRHNFQKFAHESTRKQFMCRSGRKGVGSSHRIPYGRGIMTM